MRTVLMILFVLFTVFTPLKAQQLTHLQKNLYIDIDREVLKTKDGWEQFGEGTPRTFFFIEPIQRTSKSYWVYLKHKPKVPNMLSGIVHYSASKEDCHDGDDEVFLISGGGVLINGEIIDPGEFSQNTNIKGDRYADAVSRTLCRLGEAQYEDYE